MLAGCFRPSQLLQRRLGFAPVPVPPSAAFEEDQRPLQERSSACTERAKLTLLVCCVTLGCCSFAFRPNPRLILPEGQAARLEGEVSVVGDLSDSLQLASEGDGCRDVCNFRGKTASCKFRVAWALQHRFKGAGSACPDALKMVQEQCPVCTSCSLASLGCEETHQAKPPPPQEPAERQPEPPPRSEFDCMEELFNWQKAWTDAKKDWCCKHKERGCATQPQRPAASAASAPKAAAPPPAPSPHKDPPAAAPAPPTQASPVATARPAAAADVPQTSTEALTRLFFGLFTGPAFALASSFLGSFLGLALFRKCRGRDLQPPAPVANGGYGPAAGPMSPMSPNGGPPMGFPGVVPPVNRAISVPPGPPGARPGGVIPPVNRAASVPAG